MASKDDIISAIQAVADGSGVDVLRLALGDPTGARIEIGGENKAPGMAWEDDSAQDAIVEGFADWLDEYLVDIREIAIADVMEATDHILQVNAAGIAVSLPAANAVPAGKKYVIKVLNHAGCTVVGTVDGAAGPHGLAAYGGMRVYSTGTEWVTW